MQPNLTKIPESAGVYFFLNTQGETLYIGKAKNLRSRLSSYWNKGSELTLDKQTMISQVADIDYTVVNNETEAFLLEAALIKKHLPPFNIVLRDDKSWTYLVLTNEPFPRLLTVHGLKKIKGKYFGPYTSGFAARTIWRLMHKILPLRTCKKNSKTYPNGMTCVEHHLLRSHGQCTQFMNQTEYAKVVAQAVKIIQGQGNSIYQTLEHKMAVAAEKRQYELAAKLRDQIWAWHRISQPQNVAFTAGGNQDVINLIEQGRQTVITILQIRSGQLLDKINYLIERPLNQTIDETLQATISQHYAPPLEPPSEIILPKKISTNLSKILKIKITVPERGAKKKLLDLAEKNAWSYLQRINSQASIPEILYQLQKLLNLNQLPYRWECYDISNIQGNYSVGSMVVFEAGKKKPSDYRKFKIRTITGANDVASMKEVLQRRIRHTEWPEPDLIILDGGKPQLNTVLPILPENWQKKVIALAKKQEEIFLPDKSSPIRLPRHHKISLALQAIRNEAHRTAIRYYRLLHRNKFKNKK